MRLWSLHPKHPDRQGLTACWREALLAQAVLAGRTRGYTRHPQLEPITPNGRKVGRIRQRLSRWYSDGQVPKPTTAEISASAAHADTPELEN